MLKDRPALRAYEGREIVLGIRPEDLEDAAISTDTPADRRIRGRVDLREALGSEIMVHFRLDAPTVDSGDPDAIEEKTGLDVANAVGRFHPRSRVRIGDPVEVAVSSENLHFFDDRTREAIWS